MGPLIAALMSFVRSKAGQLAIGAGGAALSDVINIDVLRREAVRIAPTSDPEALEEAARQVIRMLGIDGSDVRFPPGGPENWRYFTINLTNGQTWFHRQYRSSKSVRALLRARTAAPSRVVGGGYRSTNFRSNFRRG